MVALYRKRIFASLVLFCVGGFPEESNLSEVKLKANEESENYKIVKISNRDSIGKWDSKTNSSYIDLKEMRDFILTEGRENSNFIAQYVAEITNNYSKRLILKNLIKREYDFSSYWTDAKNPLNVDSFQKISYESDLNAFLGPFAFIPTRIDGVARFNLRHNEEIVQFISFASKKTFTIKPKYWAYFQLFQPQNKTTDENDIVILVADAPNNSLRFNGTYVVVPKRIFASSKTNFNR